MSATKNAGRLDILMPALAAGMEEGKVARWLKQPGEAVAAGEIIAEIESDKAVMELASESAGLLQAILAQVDEIVPVNAVIGTLRVDTNAAADPETGPAADAGLSAAGYRELPHSSVRKVIARRLTQAKTSIPHFYLQADCDLDALLELRSRLNANSSSGKLSINDFVIKAAAMALRAVPEVNVSWSDDSLRVYDQVNVAVAVSTPSGLITPILRDADAKSLARISTEARHLAARARNNELQPDEYQGSGVTISNLGMYGVRSFAAIINPPQSCILAIGAAERRPVVRGDACVAATVMSCTLSFDHRSVDGVLGARYLESFRALLEQPGRLTAIT